ncbi:hypothetical protein NIES4102_14880 [Chondrocystis sp. NIES-4102]|nr:hypothetical protein NIES4102_14880 [Chondrocystis sp. NIES-4102]
MDTATAQQAIESTSQLTGLPCNDVVRFGGESLIDAINT